MDSVEERDARYADRIRECREALGWSQNRLATEYGPEWRQTTVSRLESGDQTLKLREAVRLCEVFRMTLDDFASSNLVPCNCPSVVAALWDTLARVTLGAAREAVR